MGNSAALAGGFVPGSVVFSLIDYDDDFGQVRKGDKGEVIGPATLEQYDLLCQFRSHPMKSMKTSELSLAGGFMPGSVVFSLIDFDGARGQVRKGDRGEVIGSTNLEQYDLLCQFCNHRRKGVKKSEVTLAGGFMPGSVVICLVDFDGANGKVRKGDRGKVIGSVNLEQYDLLCQFPNHPKKGVKASEVSLAGGFMAGCVVFSLVDSNDAYGQVQKGDKGRVIGSANIEQYDLLCQFPNHPAKGVKTSEVNLAGGFMPGSVVFSLVDFDGAYGQLRKGDKGEVMGSSNLDKDDLLCQFPNHPRKSVKISEVTLAGEHMPNLVALSFSDLIGPDGQVTNGDNCESLGLRSQGRVIKSKQQGSPVGVFAGCAGCSTVPL